MYFDKSRLAAPAGGCSITLRFGAESVAGYFFRASTVRARIRSRDITDHPLALAAEPISH
jgi:hypothetical protein